MSRPFVPWRFDAKPNTTQMNTRNFVIGSFGSRFPLAGYLAVAITLLFFNFLPAAELNSEHRLDNSFLTFSPVSSGPHSQGDAFYTTAYLQGSSGVFYVMPPQGERFAVSFQAKAFSIGKVHGLGGRIPLGTRIARGDCCGSNNCDRSMSSSEKYRPRFSRHVEPPSARPWVAPHHDPASRSANLAPHGRSPPLVASPLA